MSHDQNAIKYVKHNKVRIKACIKREEITKMPFWSSLKKGLTSKKGSRYGGVVRRRQKEELTEVESMHQHMLR